MTDEGQLRTTVVVPVWDGYVAPRFEQALASLAAQSVPAGVIVVDNASHVPLPALNGVEVIRMPERVSLGAARNAGLAATTTPNVMFWDADDLMLPGTLAFLEAELTDDLVAFGTAIIEDPSGVRHRWPRHWIARLVRHRRVFASVNCVWSTFPTTGATLMRTAVVRACGGYGDADGGEDWSLGAVLAFRGQFGWSERPGRRYLQHRGSVWDAHRTARHQLSHAAAVRTRLAGDGAVPPWLRHALPLVGVAQWGAVGAHLLVELGRRRRRHKESSAP